MNGAQADSLTVAVDAMAAALTGGGLSNEQVARLVVEDKRAAGVLIFMLAHGLAGYIDETCDRAGIDRAEGRRVYLEALRFATIAHCAGMATERRVTLRARLARLRRLF